jgi:hypothetical protein
MVKQFDIALKDLIPTPRFSEWFGCDSLMSSPSRLAGGYQKLSENIEENLLSKNVNLKMSQKYLMASQGDGNEAHNTRLDRNDILSKVSQEIFTFNYQR